MSQLWSPKVEQLEPYIPGEQPQQGEYIKLNTNESPYPPSPSVLDAIRTATTGDLRLYPDPEGLTLKTAIADSYAVDINQVFIGNGSDEVLAHAFQGLFKPDKPLLLPDISYSFYPAYARLYGLDLQFVALKEDFALDVGDFLQTPDNGGIVFANPNAPTGQALKRADIEDLLNANPQSVVLVDEAYVDFGGESAVPLIKDYPQLLVVHTLSKSRALAGLRVGFAIGDKGLIVALERIKNSFNSYPLGRIELAAATAALRDQDYLHTSCAKVIATREHIIPRLQSLGFSVLPSQANFIFARPPQGKAEVFYRSLKQRGILVRHFNKRRISEYLRISIGTDEEMAQFLLETEDVLKNI